MTTINGTRFSGRMLSTLGLSGLGDSRSALTNRYNYETARNQWGVSVAEISVGETGGFSPNDYNRARSFYISRGASRTYADTMGSLAIDCSDILGVDVQFFLENNYPGNQARFGEWAVRSSNLLRDPGNQLAEISLGLNRNSPIRRQIRA